MAHRRCIPQILPSSGCDAEHGKWAHGHAKMEFAMLHLAAKKLPSPGLTSLSVRSVELSIMMKSRSKRDSRESGRLMLRCTLLVMS